MLLCGRRHSSRPYGRRLWLQPIKTVIRHPPLLHTPTVCCVYWSRGVRTDIKETVVVKCLILHSFYCYYYLFCLLPAGFLRKMRYEKRERVLNRTAEIWVYCWKKRQIRNDVLLTFFVLFKNNFKRAHLQKHENKWNEMRWYFRAWKMIMTCKILYKSVKVCENGKGT